MIEWYKDDRLEILFSKEPNTRMRKILPSMTKQEKDNVEKYPFVNCSELLVTLKDNKKNKVYEFTIPKKYKWDGATIPALAWCLIGARTNPKFRIPSLIHDVLCENHHYVDNDRYFADKVFERLLYVAGVNSFKRWMMFHSVDNFQKFCKW